MVKFSPALQIVSTCKVYTSQMLLYTTKPTVFAVGAASAVITSTQSGGAHPVGVVMGCFVSSCIGVTLKMD